MSSGVRERVRVLLLKAGEKGATAKELAANLKKGTNSIYCHIFRLRETNTIALRDDRYYLLPGVPAKEVKDENRPPVSSKKTYKWQTLLGLLEKAGKDGMSREELVKKLDIPGRSLFYHIRHLKKEGCNVTYNYPKRIYWIKGTVPQDLKGQGIAPSSTHISAKSAAGSNNHRITGDVKEILRLLSSEDQDNYLELWRKAQFFTNCAEAIIQSKREALTLKEEVCSAL